MSYDHGETITVSLTGINFASGAGTRKFRMPAGKEGVIVGCCLSATTTFTADTTPGYFRVGITGDLAKYLELSAGTTAAGAALDATNQTGAVKTETATKKPKILPKDTDIALTVVAPTGGTPAGVGDVHLTLRVW